MTDFLNGILADSGTVPSDRRTRCTGSPALVAIKFAVAVCIEPGHDICPGRTAARALQGVGEALLRQGRIAESKDVLHRAIVEMKSLGESRRPAYRGLLSQLQKSLAETEEPD